MELQNNFQMHNFKERQAMVTFSFVVFVIVGMLLLLAVSGVGVKPIKKIFCPFCGRKIGSAKECPYCGQKVS
jgi:hypothetical protein